MLNKLLDVCVVFALVASGDAAGAELKKLRTGTTVGELKSVSPAKNKRDVEIEVLAPGEERARRYTIGAHKKELLAAVKAAAAGDRVEVDWFDTVEGLCVDKFQVLKKAKTEQDK